MNYFIVGLPRSRTAWLSVFMSQSSKRCIHDGFNGCNNLIEYWDKLADGGDSNTGLALIDINRLKPESPIVVIRKNEAELQKTIDWCNEEFKQDHTEHLNDLNNRLKDIKGLHIKQSEINNNLERIWSHLVDDEWRPEYAKLTDLNIQVMSTFGDEFAAQNFMGDI